MLILNRRDANAVEQVIKFVEWRAASLESQARISTLKREQMKFATAAAAMYAVATDLRTAVNNGDSLVSNTAVADAR